MKQVAVFPMHASRRSPQWGIWFLVTLCVMLAPVAGLLAVTGSIFLVSIPVILVLAAVLVFHPWLFTWFVLFSALVVLGVIRLYAPQFQIMRWLVPLLTVSVPVAVLLVQAFKPAPAEQGRLPALFWWLTVFVFAAMVTTLLNWSGIMTAISGAKGYFQVWGLLVVFATIYYRGDFTRGMTFFLLGLALLQIPFVLHQQFFLVPIRAASALVRAPDDVIAGTFGAELYGGGNNAMLAAYLFMAIGLLLSLQRQKIVPAWIAFPGMLLLGFPVFLNEAKIAFFYAWAMFIVLYWEDIVRRPLRFIVGNIFLFLFLFAFVFTYAQVAVESGKAHTIGEYLTFLKETNLYRGYATYELNRWTALTFWYQEHFPHDFWHALIGHGLGETQEGALVLDVGNTIAARRYSGMGIGLTSLSALLWEVGLLGLTIVALVFVSAFRLAGRLARASSEQPLALALFRGLQAAVAIMALSIPHKSSLVSEMTFQSLFVLIVGYLVYSARYTFRHSGGHGLRSANG